MAGARTLKSAHLLLATAPERVLTTRTAGDPSWSGEAADTRAVLGKGLDASY